MAVVQKINSGSIQPVKSRIFIGRERGLPLDSSNTKDNVGYHTDLTIDDMNNRYDNRLKDTGMNTVPAE